MKIAILYTGGTIGCVGNPLAPMNTDDFSSAFKNLITPILQQQYPDIAIDFPPITFPESSSGTLDSTNLQPSDWCLMAEWVLNTYTQYDGWVVLHGTDSMDFTGPALSFLLSDCNELGFPTAMLSKPVVITGSQVPLFYRASAQSSLAINYNTDAFQNVCGAVASAQSGVPEVGVYFQNQLYRGNRTVKTNASQFNAFSSPNYPALGEYGIELDIDFMNVLPLPATPALSLDTPSTLSALQKRLTYIAQNIDAFPAMQFNAFPAAYSATGGTAVIANLIDACVATGITGLVLESYGEGNFPSGNPDNPAAGATYQALANANAAGVVIVDCTQVLSGTVNDSAYAAGAWLPAVGALSPADMTPMAALAKVIILSTVAAYHGWPADIVKTLVQTDLVGEMKSVNRLDGWSQTSLAAGQSITTLDGSATLSNDPVLGPVLLGSGNTSPLWQALTSPVANSPGRLVIEQDGNLVFYDRTGMPLWGTNIVPAGPISSALVLAGSYTDDTLSLYLYNYAQKEVTDVLYDGSGGN